MTRIVRGSRNRIEREGELQAWALPFETGVDLLGGIVVDGVRPYRGKAVPLALAEEKWRVLGAEFLARRKELAAVAGEKPWALEQFGPPRHQGRRR